MTFTDASPKMASELRERRGPSHAGGDTRIKTAGRQPCTPVREATTQNARYTGWRRGRRGRERSPLLGAAWCSHVSRSHVFGRRLGGSLQTEHALTTRSAATLGVEPKELKTQVHAKPCTHRFVAALIAVAKAWWKPSDRVNRAASRFPGKQ